MARKIFKHNRAIKELRTCSRVKLMSSNEVGRVLMLSPFIFFKGLLRSLFSVIISCFLECCNLINKFINVLFEGRRYLCFKVFSDKTQIFVEKNDIKFTLERTFNC